MVPRGSSGDGSSGDAEQVDAPDLSGYDTSPPERYEWLLSDHPWALAERRRRVEANRTARIAAVDAIRQWTDRTRSADPDLVSGPVGSALRDMADRLGRRADESSLRIEVDGAEPDEVAVLRWRARWEASRRESDPGYRYPAHLVGPGAAAYPPPGWHG